MIIFEKIRFKNFLSYGENWTEIDLNNAKDTLIIGENGAGKSTFMDALSYALYMKPFRKVNNPQLVNSINKKHLKVEVEFRIGSHSYKVVRGHAPRLFEVYQDGDLLNQDAHTKDYQKVLEQQILKMNYKSFSQIVVLGSRNFIPFMQLSSPDRRTVIEDLLDIQIFTHMANLLKDRIQTNKNDLIEAEHQVDLINQKIDIQQEYITKLETDSNTKKKSLQKDIKDRQKEIDKLREEANQVNETVKELSEQVSNHDKLKEKTRTLVSLEKQIEQKISKLQSKVHFFCNENDCPTCGQEIDDEFKQSEIEKTNGVLGTTKRGLVDIGTEIQKTEESIRDQIKVLDQISNLQAEITTRYNRISGIESYIESIEKNLSAEETEQSNLTEKKNALAELQQLEEEQIVNRTNLRRQKVIYDTASTLLKDTGIKSRIIKQYVPVINKLVNKYLASMEFFVDFHLDEDFNETIRSRHRDVFSYNSFSEGEKMRIDLALLFTWRAIAKLKNSASTNVLIMDEVFDSSLDSGGTDEFLKIIKELTSDTNIIIISHKTDQLVDKFSNVLKFEKHKNFSRLVT